MRIRLSRSAALVALLLASWSVLSGGSTEDQGKQVVAEALEALGGQKFLNMHSRTSSGRVYSFFRDEMNALEVAHTYTEYSGPPEKGALGVRERQFLGKKQDYSFLFLEKQGWDITFRGARPIDPDRWDKYVRSTENDILYILKVRHDEPGMMYDFVGSQVYLSRHVEIVDLTDSVNRTVRVYFDHNTKLPMRQVFSWLDPETKYRNEEITEYDKFRDIGGGVMWPFTVERQRNGYKSFQFFANSVEVNGSMPPKVFDLPAGAKTPRP
jgi:hypothetical protein